MLGITFIFHFDNFISQLPQQWKLTSYSQIKSKQLLPGTGLRCHITVSWCQFWNAGKVSQSSCWRELGQVALHSADVGVAGLWQSRFQTTSFLVHFLPNLWIKKSVCKLQNALFSGCLCTGTQMQEAVLFSFILVGIFPFKKVQSMPISALTKRELTRKLLGTNSDLSNELRFLPYRISYEAFLHKLKNGNNL